MAADLVAGVQSELWHGLVRDAEQRSQRKLDEELESYLVFTLMRFVGDGALAERVMALDFLDGAQSTGRHKDLKLRDVGDRCLLLAGLYPQQARRRHVSLSYFCDLGRNAYSELAAHLRQALRSLYARLADAFTSLVGVLVEVRRLSGEWSGLDPLGRAELTQNGGQLDVDEAQRQFPGAIVIAGAGHA